MFRTISQSWCLAFAGPQQKEQSDSIYSDNRMAKSTASVHNNFHDDVLLDSNESANEATDLSGMIDSSSGGDLAIIDEAISGDAEDSEHSSGNLVDHISGNSKGNQERYSFEFHMVGIKTCRAAR